MQQLNFQGLFFLSELKGFSIFAAPKNEPGEWRGG